MNLSRISSLQLDWRSLGIPAFPRLSPSILEPTVHKLYQQQQRELYQQQQRGRRTCNVESTPLPCPPPHFLQRCQVKQRSAGRTDNSEIGVEGIHRAYTIQLMERGEIGLDWVSGHWKYWKYQN